MLKVVNLKKRYSLDHGNVDALRGISFEVAENQFFTLLGPSGSGKSTAMRCIAGLEHPLSGEIFIDDQCVYSSIKGIQISPDLRPIGMVFQSYAIWPHMTVFKNVAFPLVYGTKEGKQSRTEVFDAVGEALRLVQMSEFSERPATQLSGGQQQRVALARALVRHPKLLLLDEPLSNLDAKLREEMRIELKELTNNLGITSLFVTHDQVEALALSDQIGVIMDGSLVEVGEPQKVYGEIKDKRVATFLGIANTIRGKILLRGSPTKMETAMGPLHIYDCPLEADRETLVAIRPEALICSRKKPDKQENVFEGTIKRMIFLGTFIDAEIQVKGQSLRASLTPYENFNIGDNLFIHIPSERCRVVT